MKRLLGIGLSLLVAVAAWANTIIINFGIAGNADSLVADVYNYDPTTLSWIGAAPTDADAMTIAIGGWENSGFLVGSAPENWFNGDWNALKNTYGYAGEYSFNGMNMTVSAIPTAWGIVTVNPWWGGYGPNGDWKNDKFYSGTGSISTGDIDNGGAFGAIRITGLDLPEYGSGVPEPGTIVLLGSLLGLGAIGGLRKRFFGAKKSVVA